MSALSPAVSPPVPAYVSPSSTNAQVAAIGLPAHPTALSKDQEKSRRKLNPFSKLPITDGRYENFVSDELDKYPRGYPSIAAFISADIDGRIYRRFSYPRNRLLLWYQDRVVCLEDELKSLDEADRELGNSGDAEARQRLISRRYDEKYSKTRKELFENLEVAMEKYDDLILREHEIMSIKKAPAKMHKALYDFMWNGQEDSDGKTRKHLLKKEYEFLYRTDDFVILGNQDDAWLGSFAESVKYLLPKKIRRMVLASSKDRKKSANVTNVSFYSNRRIGAYVKGIVCAANTVLLAVPVIVLYALSISNSSGWLKIGVLLSFVAIFAFLLAALTNASRSEMFAGSAGYCAVLIVFLTYSGP